MQQETVGISNFTCQREQGQQVDKQSNLGRFSWKTQIFDLRKAAMKIFSNSMAILCVLPTLLTLQRKMETRQSPIE
ncbi:hypothetical protein C3V39_01670 [Prevotella sp. oral taxon 820]|nr:hypothetical protein C3V39_01670 [Prevotella sp. oral taxon 820]